MVKENLYGLSNKKLQCGPYPVEKLKRVAQPTTKITGNISQVSERDSGFIRAALGQFGPLAKTGNQPLYPKGTRWRCRKLYGQSSAFDC